MGRVGPFGVRMGALEHACGDALDIGFGHGHARSFLFGGADRSTVRPERPGGAETRGGSYPRTVRTRTRAAACWRVADCWVRRAVVLTRGPIVAASVRSSLETRRACSIHAKTRRREDTERTNSNPRHSRESGNPGERERQDALGPRLRGDDET